jgi:hypothetical protein
MPEFDLGDSCNYHSLSGTQQLPGSAKMGFVGPQFPKLFLHRQ